MSSVTTPDLFTGEQPVNISNLDKIVGTDPSVFAVTKTNDYSDGGPTPPYRYFGTGDIAKLQSAVLLSDTSGSWNNPDVRAGGAYPDPNYAALYTQYEGCICANGGTIGGFPAWWFFAPKFLDGGPVATAWGNTACFKDEDSLKFYLTSPTADGGAGLNKDKQLPSTYLFTESQNVVPAINEIVGATGLPKDGYANFNYYKLKTDQLTTTFEDHLGPIFTSADYARIKYKIGLADSVTDAYYQGNLYSGLEVNYDAQTGFAGGFHNISGNIVYTTGDQLITGPKAFQKYTTFNTGVAISGDALISGGLTVNNPSTFNSEVAVSGDTIISGGLTVNKHAVLNSGVTVNSGDLTLNSGNLNMSGNLGVTGNSYLSGELWILGPEGPCRVACSGNSIFDDGITVNNSDLTINNGNLNMSGDLNVTGNLNMSGDLNVTGNLNMSGDLNVTGNSYLSGQLWILGSDGKPCRVACSGEVDSFNKDMTFNSGVSISGDLRVTGNSYLSGELWILGPDGEPCKVACSGDSSTFNQHTTFNSGVTVNSGDLTLNSGNLNMSGDLNLTGNAYISGQLWILGPDGEPCRVACSGDSSTFNQHTTFNSGVTVNSGDLTLNSGNLNMSGDLNVTGNAYISGQLWILGPDGEPCRVACSGAGGITVEGDTTNFNSTNVNISGDTLISGGLTVNKHATFNSGVTVNSGDLTINSGNLNMSGDLNLTGNAYISGQLWILGPDGEPCRVACSGESSADTFSSYVTFNSGVSISGDTIISGGLTVNNHATFNSGVSISGDLNVTGNSYLSGELWILGPDGEPCRVACSGDSSTFNQHTTFNSGVTVNSGDLTLNSGNLNMSGDLNVTGNAYISGQLWILGLDGEPCRVACSGDSSADTFSSYVTFNSGVSISGDTIISGGLTVNNHATFNSGVSVSGDLHVTGNSYLSGELWILGLDGEPCRVACSGDSSADTFSSYVTFNSGVSISGDTIISGGLTVNNHATFNSGVSISGDLNVTGNSYLSGELWILGPDGEPCRVACSGDSSTFNQHTTFNSGVTVNSGDLTLNSGNLNMSGDLNLTGNAYISGQLWILGPDGKPCRVACSGDSANFNQYTTFNSGVAISGDTIISGGLTVKNHAAFNSGVSISGDLNVTGNSYLSGELWILGSDGAPCRVACSGDGSLPVGIDTQVLVADSSSPGGVKWNSSCLVQTGCHGFGEGRDPLFSSLGGFIFPVGHVTKIQQFDDTFASTSASGTSLMSYNYGCLGGTISGAAAWYQLQQQLFGGSHNSITGYVGMTNAIFGGGSNKLINSHGDSATTNSAPWYTYLIGGQLNEVTGYGLHGGLLLGGAGNKILAHNTFGNPSRTNPAVADAGYNCILGGRDSLITQTEAYNVNYSNDTTCNIIIGGERGAIKNQRDSVLIQAGDMWSSTHNNNYAHTGDGTLGDSRGRTITLAAGNGIFASGNLYVTGDPVGGHHTWVRVSGGGGGSSVPDTFNTHVTFNSGVSISGDTIISGALTVNNHAAFNSGVSISGDTIISGGLTVNNHATFNSGVSISGDLTVTGSSTFSHANITGDLGVSGCIKSYQCVTDSSAASYTLSASDFGKIIHYNPPADAVFNLPTTASVPTIADGWQTTVMNLSSNKITLTPLGGLALKSDGTIIATQYQAATIYYKGGDWYAAGALST